MLKRDGNDHDPHQKKVGETMIHDMNLHSEPFEKMKKGTKTIELRLNDEKRRLIRAGDLIEFHHALDRSEKLMVKVVQIFRFRSFAELYSALPLDQCGYRSDELATADPGDMDQYYPKEKQDLYGVLGIQITLDI